MHDFTDGSRLGNGKESSKAGLGVWFNEDHPENISKIVEGKRANNATELEAAVATISQTKKSNIKKLRIHTGSQFLINACTHWLPKWETNGWVMIRNRSDISRLGFERLRDDLQFR